jgi:hypothetical protein
MVGFNLCGVQAQSGREQENQDSEEKSVTEHGRVERKQDDHKVRQD